MTYPKVLTQKF